MNVKEKAEAHALESLAELLVEKGTAPDKATARQMAAGVKHVADAAEESARTSASALAEAQAQSRWYDKYRVVDRVPEGKAGNVVIQKVTLTPDEARLANLRFAIHREPRRAVPGTYLQLRIAGALVMSDTPDEIADHMRFIEQAEGKVLIAGLGIGMVTLAVAAKPEVSEVVVLEVNPHVIKLVGPSMPEKVRVVKADALTWTPAPGEVFDRAWMDIWSDISTENLTQMAALRRRYRPFMRAQTANVIGCWSREWAMMMRDRERSWRHRQ